MNLHVPLPMPRSVPRSASRRTEDEGPREDRMFHAHAAASAMSAVVCSVPSGSRSWMATYENVLVPVPLRPESDTLRRAVAAYLARFKGQSRVHTESDLRAYLTWCSSHSLDPLTAQRPHLELYIRWMQETAATSPRP